jgi:hypothetical protein
MTLKILITGVNDIATGIVEHQNNPAFLLQLGCFQVTVMKLYGKLLLFCLMAVAK